MILIPVVPCCTCNPKGRMETVYWVRQDVSTCRYVSGMLKLRLRMATFWFIATTTSKVRCLVLSSLMACRMFICDRRYTFSSRSRCQTPHSPNALTNSLCRPIRLVSYGFSGTGKNVRDCAAAHFWRRKVSDCLSFIVPYLQDLMLAE